MSIHEEYVRSVLSSRYPSGTLKSRESNTVEFKQSFNKGSTATYAKTMAAFSNNRGGYIIFGVTDAPRTIIGLTNNNFENMSQEQFTESINTLFAPAMEWECGTLSIDIEETVNGEKDFHAQKNRLDLRRRICSKANNCSKSKFRRKNICW